LAYLQPKRLELLFPRILIPFKVVMIIILPEQDWL